MTGRAALGALLGIALALGVAVLIDRIRASRRPRLVERIARHSTLRRSSIGASLAEHGAVGTMVELLRPTLAWVSEVADRRGDGRERLVARLSRAGRDPDPSRHDLARLAWATGGALVGVVLVLRAGADAPAKAIVLVVLPAAAAVMVHDWLLTRAIRQRSRRMALELPGIAELLAFAVAAGESPVSALDRVSRTSSGVLAAELAVTVADVRGSMTLDAALRRLSQRCGTPMVERFVDGILVAIERGTPMADVLRAQASDCRAASRRELMETAGRRDVLMLVPVVFLVLPIVVVVALFPGIHGLDLAAP